MRTLLAAAPLLALAALAGACRSSPTRAAPPPAPATVRAAVEQACPRARLEQEWLLAGKLVPYGVRCAQHDSSGTCLKCEGSQALTDDSRAFVLLGAPQQWDNKSGTPGCPDAGPLADATAATVRGRLDPAGLPWSVLEGAPVLTPAAPPAPGAAPDAVPVGSLAQELCSLPAAPVTLQGVTRFVHGSCTKMLCPPGNPCCNNCSGRVLLHDDGEGHGAFLSAPACQGSNCELRCGDMQANASYEVHGVIVLDPARGGLVVDVRTARQTALAPAR